MGLITTKKPRTFFSFCAAMVVKKIVLKVSITCDKCKTCIMKAVAKLGGVNSMALDLEKGTLTVIGTVDPVLIVKAIRKIGKAVDIDSVGEDKKPEEKQEPEKKEPEEQKPECKPLPPCCSTCQPVAIGYVTYDFEPNWCTIL